MAIIDRAQLSSLRELAAGDDSFVVAVIDAFLPQLESTPGDLRQALGQGDAQAVAELAHSLKGSAANVGAMDVRDLALEIEQLGRAGDLQAVSPLIDRLASSADATALAYRDEKAKLG